MINLVKTHVQSSVRHLEAISRELKGKVPFQTQKWNTSLLWGQ